MSCSLRVQVLTLKDGEFRSTWETMGVAVKLLKANSENVTTVDWLKWELDSIWTKFKFPCSIIYMLTLSHLSAASFTKTKELHVESNILNVARSCKNIAFD